MAINKDKKKSILEKLEKIFSEAKSVAFVNFHGLSVFGATELRKALKVSQVGYFVAKKTLIRKALGGKKVAGELPALEGEIGIAWSDEVTAPAREVYAFAKKLGQGLALVGGIFEAKFLGKEGITAIAMIPDKKTLRAQFVNLINSPIQRLVIGLSEISKVKAK
ncbi:MAG TPA: 50S ribosomal protein L10 [Candidatus Paceibacterota bacterium]